MVIDEKLLSELLARAADGPRRRVNLDLRDSQEEGTQRMLNALLPGTRVPIHRHPWSSEDVLLLRGRLVEVLYEEERPGDGFERGMDAQDVVRGTRLRVVERIELDPAAGRFGCALPPGVWHTVEVLEPSVIFEVKAGKYGEDGSEMF